MVKRFLTKPAKLFSSLSYFRGQPSAWLEMRNRSFPVTNFVCPDKTVKPLTRMPTLPERSVIPHLLRNPLRPLGHSHGKPTPCVSLCAGDAGLRRHDGSPVKGHPDAEKSCHRVAPATERRDAAAVALRYQSACPSTLLRDPADGEAQQQKKGFEGFVTHFFLTKPAKLFSSFILFPRTTVRLVGNAQPLISCDKLRLPR